MKVKTSPECPKCGSRVKRLPPGRQDHYHVYCDDCGHDFGRYDYLQAQFRHLLDDVEAQLKEREKSGDGAS